MNLEQTRSTLLVRAVETTDRDGVLLPQAIRDRCTAEAGPPEVPDGDGTTLGPQAQAFLVRRAALAQAELARRYPELEVLGGGLGLGALLRWIAALAILVVGFLSASAWKDQPLQLLGFPLLWLIAWNLLVYLWLVVAALPGAGRVPRPLVDLVARVLARLRMPRWPGAGGRDGGTAAAVPAAAQFLREWLPLQVPLLLARAKALLHAGALLLTLGMMAGLVLLGLRVHYMAGWESSWGVTAEGLHALLSAVLAPAAWITPESVAAMPTLEDIRSWSFQDGGRGGHAWDLVKLFVVAAFLYVVVPRALLWAWSRRGAARSRVAFYSPPSDDRYYRRLLQAGRGTGEVAAVFCHGLEPTSGLRARLRAALADELGGRVTLEFMPPVAYGEEAGVAEALAGHEERERMVAVFSLAATPEEEVQGELLRQLAAHVPAGGGPPPLLMLDAAPLEHFESDGGFRAHCEDRLRTWQRFAQGHGATLRVLASGGQGGTGP